jgi:alcohol dehydrogenase
VVSGAVKPGDTVAIVGAGPIGLAALLTAQFHSPAEIILVDPDPNRLEVAKRFGATAVVDPRDGHAAAALLKLTGGRGVDVAIEAVGIPATFELCEDIVAAGGHIANVGVHGKPASLKLEKLWAHNITLTTRLVDTVTTPMLIRTVQAGKLQPRKLVTHTFRFDQLEAAYDTFARAAQEKALKVLIKNG